MRELGQEGPAGHGGVPPRIFGAALISALSLALILAGTTRVSAHFGDEIYFYYELRDEDLARIDVTDGSVEDWLEIVGEPSLTASDFFWRNHAYDPSEVDFRIWLAWHQGSGTLWIAMERFDDLYFNLYDGEKRWEMQNWDSSIRFMVDGDHSGGEYSYLLGWECQECTPDQVLENNRQAQDWMAIAETPDGKHLFHDGASEWVFGEPYAAAGGGVLGESPATTVTEVKVTPFDDLIYDDEAVSKASQLYPGKIIGFGMVTIDNDDTQWKDGYGRRIAMTLWGGIKALRNADLMVDGLLVGLEKTLLGTTMVPPLSRPPGGGSRRPWSSRSRQGGGSCIATLSVGCPLP